MDLSSKYKWTQDFHYVSLLIERPNKEKVRVVFQPNYLQVFFNNEIYLEGELFDKISIENSSWYIDDGVLNIELAKLHPKDLDGIWEKCFLNDSQPSYKKYEVSYSEMSEEFCLKHEELFRRHNNV